MQVTVPFCRSAEVAREVGCDIMSCLQYRTISYKEFVQELERMLDLAGYLGVVWRPMYRPPYLPSIKKVLH